MALMDQLSDFLAVTTADEFLSFSKKHVDGATQTSPGIHAENDTDFYLYFDQLIDDMALDNVETGQTTGAQPIPAQEQDAQRSRCQASEPIEDTKNNDPSTSEPVTKRIVFEDGSADPESVQKMQQASSEHPKLKEPNGKCNDTEDDERTQTEKGEDSDTSTGALKEFLEIQSRGGLEERRGQLLIYSGPMSPHRPVEAKALTLDGKAIKRRKQKTTRKNIRKGETSEVSHGTPCLDISTYCKWECS